MAISDAKMAPKWGVHNLAEAGFQSGFVMIGSHVSIYASNHKFADTSVPMTKQGLDLKGIWIEQDVWVGTGVCILDGVRVGMGSVLAAGAVITNSTESYSINAGVPARQLGSRTTASKGLGCPH